MLETVNYHDNATFKINEDGTLNDLFVEENSDCNRLNINNGIKSYIKMKLGEGESTSGRRGRKESDGAAVTVPL